MTPEQEEALRAPFPPDLIYTLPKAGNPRYVSHAHVTDRLLAVDPEWTWEPGGYDLQGLPAIDDQGGLWIKLTVCGVTRYGYGDPQSGQSQNARKEAISDALRNAAMRFGVGLDLWMKDTPAVEATDRQVKITDAQVRKIQAALTDRGLDRDQRLAGMSKIVGRQVDSTKDLTAAEARKVIDTL